MTMDLLLHQLPSPIGTVLLVTDAAGTLRALDFADHEARMRRLLRLQYGDVELCAGPDPVGIRDALLAYFGGDTQALSCVPVTTGGTVFQRSVWSALRAIPAGETRSYGAVAAALGKPGAARAVGLANGANPVAIVVPCHRVIGADASLTGFGGGLHRKRWLLRHEGVAVRDAAPSQQDTLL